MLESQLNVNPNLKKTDDPFKSRHNLTTTQQTVKRFLAGGTPDWVRFPNDYRAFAEESYLAEKEKTEFMAADYRWPDQDILADLPSRRVNIKSTRDIIQTLRHNDVKNVRCFTVDNGLAGTVALWAARPNSQQMTYICYIQIPFMCEWSVLRLDRRQLPSGERYRGWRTMVSQLVVKGILTEQEAHEIFGHPIDGPVSRRYRRTMFYFRNNIDPNAQELTTV